MKKLTFFSLLAAILTVELNIIANPTLPQPISFTNVSMPINTQLVDQQDLSQLKVKFNGEKNPQVLLVLYNAVIKYWNGNDQKEWKTLHSGTGWDGGMAYEGGGTTKIVATLEVQFNEGKDPYIVVGEWGGFIDFYNGSQWQAISQRNFTYDYVSTLNVKFNGENLPQVIAGFGSGDGGVAVFNGNSDLTWTQISSGLTNFVTQYMENWSVQSLFIGPSGDNGIPNMIGFFANEMPAVNANLYLNYYSAQNQQWQPLIRSSYLDYYMSEVYAQLDESNYYLVFQVLPNNNFSGIPAQIKPEQTGGNPQTQSSNRIVFYNGSKYSTLLDTSTMLSGKFDAQLNGSSNPYIVVTTADSRIAFFNGTKWVILPQPGLNITKMYTQFNGSNYPYIVVADTYNLIKFFNGEKWIMLNEGNQNITQNYVSGKSSILRVNFNGTNNPQMVLADIKNEAAYFYNGNQWTNIYSDPKLTKDNQTILNEEGMEFNASIIAQKNMPGGFIGQESAPWYGMDSDTVSAQDALDYSFNPNVESPRTIPENANQK